MEKQLELTQKIYKCRNAARSLYGDEYEEKIHGYKSLIKACMAKHKLPSNLEAAIHLIDEYKDMPGIDVAAMNILAAYADLAEEKTEQ